MSERHSTYEKSDPESTRKRPEMIPNTVTSCSISSSNHDASEHRRFLAAPPPPLAMFQSNQARGGLCYITLLRGGLYSGDVGGALRFDRPFKLKMEALVDAKAASWFFSLASPQSAAGFLWPIICSHSTNE